MRLPRIFVPVNLSPGLELNLPQESARHVRTVLRLEPGSNLILFDGTGLNYPSRIVSANAGNVSVTVGNGEPANRESMLKTTLLQGICRGSRMDLVVQKATELGVTAIQPLVTERVVVRLDDKRRAKRIEHWQRIAIAASEQSGRAVVPEIRSPVTLETAFQIIDSAATRLLLDPRGQAKIADSLSDAASVAILIGPEGGLTQSEQQDAAAAGFVGIRLGPRVLRTETAPLAALTIVQYLRGDLG